MVWPILLMARELDQGGSERQMTEVARALDRTEFEPHVGCFRPEGLRGDELRAAGVPVVQFPVHSFRSPAALQGARQLARFIRERRIALVHTFDYPLNVFGVPVARFFSSAVVVSSQRAHRELTPGIYRHLLRMTDHLVDAIVVNCEFVKRHLIEQERVSPHLIRLCHNGIDPDRFRPLGGPPPPALDGSPFVIGVVCALRPEKGLATLLEAFAQIRHLRPGMKLAIVGSGPVLPQLQSMAQALSISDSCVFEPATQRVPGWLRAMDIFVLPSLTEALSNSLMEAMACGSCAVASRVGGNPELVRDGETGLLFERQNVEGLAGVLAKLVQDESLRASLADNGLKFIRENFSLAQSARRMGEIYRELLASKPDFNLTGG